MRRNVVLLTRRYPASKVGDKGNRLYVAPSGPSPMRRGEHARAELVERVRALQRDERARLARLERLEHEVDIDAGVRLRGSFFVLTGVSLFAWNGLAQALAWADVYRLEYREYIALNGFGRFFIEMLRVNPVVLFGLTEPQIVGLLLVAGGLGSWLYFLRRSTPEAATA